MPRAASLLNALQGWIAGKAGPARRQTMIAKQLQTTFSNAVNEAVLRRHEYITLEHLLFALLDDPSARDVLVNCGADLEALRVDLDRFLSEQYDEVAADTEVMPVETATFRRILEYALLHVQSSAQKELDGAHMLAALLQAERPQADR